LARAYLADAWAIHETRGEPFPGRLFVYRPFFGEAPIQARRRKPDLSAYRLENIRLSPANFKKEAVSVLGHPAFDELWFSSGEAYGILDQFSKGGRQELSPKQFDDFVVRIFPLERHLLLSRMAANLEVESLAGRAEKNINRLAARMWLGISEEVMPFHEIPFVRSLCRQSAEKILYNLKLGFRNQAEANAVTDEKNGRPRPF
jgi:hypothetical protein